MRGQYWTVCIALMFISCQPATPLPPVMAGVEEEFILSVGQSALIDEAELKITLKGVPGDQRCPLEIECAISGPITLTIAIQSESDAPQEFSFTTFTDNDGTVSSVDFQGMQTQVKINGYTVQIKRITPFPLMSFAEIEDDEYRVSLVVKQ
jgi:hypothetical protein